MRSPELDHEPPMSVSLESTSEAGPSYLTLDKVANSNGYTNGKSASQPLSNGSSAGLHNGAHSHPPVSRVKLPGSRLYEDLLIDREEYVRLVIQSLRDVGYIESAATLEAESGYSLETGYVSEFRQCILEGSWSQAEALLPRLGVVDETSLWAVKFLIGQQKYLELLEAGKTAAALQVLRTELAPLNVGSDQLHSLSSLIMFSNPKDLCERAGWDGASGTSRDDLLFSLQRHISSTTMIPQRRLATLLSQAQLYQRQQCFYHNSPANPQTFSLFMDHECDKEDFPRVTTTILEVHTDEVWNIAWSHDGRYLASAGKDKTAIIWRIGHETEPTSRECVAELVLRDHEYCVGCLAWSLDDSILLTTADQLIKMWNAKDGTLLRTLDEHQETVTALSWLPDGSGFISGSLDRKIVTWDSDGKKRDSWPISPMRITDMAISPDFSRLVTVGMTYSSPPDASGDRGSSPALAGDDARPPRNQVIVYHMDTKEVAITIPLGGELTSVKISEDSQFALINHAPHEVHLYDLVSGRLARKFTGQHQGHHVIRSCFGGIDNNFVASGSEDANVYIWHRDTGVLLEVLSGHGNGSVNSVAWNPQNERMFASCSDDSTIRIWESAPPEISMMEPEPPIGKGKGKQQWDGVI
ncbi:WD40 repeat-like protein [Coniophora puteana RWD-64-598 SS2]|uniref:WD40 repeat-like protein n=1 Tax=Coniophora puteana (strain RWD-64-598) TaxID=741705 RepID=A0A5M3N0Y2_CONPW|nr:WD40 repeat-like protein [Coniophora puteana RWD-64-598 SS2]EIW84917.1 WD40 repeat-like protein [Coniophora puteana RWD-64-598 SS2]